jgi:protein-L-isoaspartate(D-aspartate) O-methyltransferase
VNSSEARRRYATQVRQKAGLGSKRLIEALETVAREDFLGPPPWRITRLPNLWNQEFTSDLAKIYDDVVVALDPARHLNNGLPSALTGLIDSLELKEGHSVLHAGTGTGYYTALIAHCVGETGRVVGLELDPQLATRARENLKQLPQVQIFCADATTYDAGKVDAILVNAGASFPCPLWLDSLKPRGTLILPLVRWPKGSVFGSGPAGFGSGIAGFGAMFRIDGVEHGFAARFLSYFHVFPCLGALDEEADRALAQAFEGGRLQEIRSFRRDAHEADSSCLLHGRGYCFSSADAGPRPDR